MSAVRQRLCTHYKTASYTSRCPWLRIVAALLASLFVMGEACDSDHFMNSTSTSGPCIECTQCDRLQLVEVEPCNATSDAVCGPCSNPNEYYAIALGRCTLDCDRVCSHGCPKDREGVCDCSYDRCLTGTLCEIRLPDCPTPDNPVTTPPRNVTVPTTRPPTDPVVLPHWGIALVSIGVIMGIVLFSALFVLLGLFTSRHRGHHDDFTSSSSNMKCSSLADRLSYSNGGTSSSLISLYTQSNSPAFQNYQLSLKHGSSHSFGGSWNNIKCSPKTQRSSPIAMSKPRDGFLTPV